MFLCIAFDRIARLNGRFTQKLPHYALNDSNIPAINDKYLRRGEQIISAP